MQLKLEIVLFLLVWFPCTLAENGAKCGAGKDSEVQQTMLAELQDIKRAMSIGLDRSNRDLECCYCPDGRTKEYELGQCFMNCPNYCNNWLAVCKNPSNHCSDPPRDADFIEKAVIDHKKYVSTVVAKVREHDAAEHGPQIWSGNPQGTITLMQDWVHPNKDCVVKRGATLFVRIDGRARFKAQVHSIRGQSCFLWFCSCRRYGFSFQWYDKDGFSLTHAPTSYTINSADMCVANYDYTVEQEFIFDAKEFLNFAETDVFASC